jgi:hypothetical protein
VTPTEWLELCRRAGRGDEAARAAILAHWRDVERRRMLERARQRAAEVAYPDQGASTKRKDRWGSFRATCPQGHPYDGVRADGTRVCRTCAREAAARYRAKQPRPEASATCRNGHALTPENRLERTDHPRCRACVEAYRAQERRTEAYRAYQRDWQRRKRAAERGQRVG